MQPLTENTIRRITALRLFAESHDQGRVSDSSQGNWTWFELAIFKDQEAAEPLSVNDLQRVEFYQENHFQKNKYEWLNGPPFERRKENLLNVLQVISLSQLWEDFAEGFIRMEIPLESASAPVSQDGASRQNLDTLLWKSARKPVSAAPDA